MHSPRVEAGPTIGGTTSIGGGRQYQLGIFGSGPFDVGPAGIQVSYGWRGRDASPAARLSVASLLPPLIADNMDLYLQIPKAASGRFDAGGGIAAMVSLGQPGSRVVYAQIGVLSDSGRGLYITQGFVKEDVPPGRIGTTSLRDDGWLGTIAYQWRNSEWDRHVFVTAIRGRPFRQHCSNQPFIDCTTLRRPYGVFVGMTRELVFRRLPRRPRDNR
jgi:hypothetical protein